MAFLTLAGFKTYAKLSSPSQDPQIEALILAAEEAIQGYIGYDFIDQTSAFRYVKQTETFLTARFQKDYLLEQPDSTVTFVTLVDANPYAGSVTSGVLTAQQNQELDDSEWFHHTALGRLTILRPLNREFYCTVEYNTVKDATQLHILGGYMLIDYWLGKDWQASITNSGQSVSRTPALNIPKHIAAILSMSRRV